MLFANVVVKVATVTPLLAWMRWCTFLYFSMAGLIEAEFAGNFLARQQNQLFHAVLIRV